VSRVPALAQRIAYGHAGDVLTMRCVLCGGHPGCAVYKRDMPPRAIGPVCNPCRADAPGRLSFPTSGAVGGLSLVAGQGGELSEE